MTRVDTSEVRVIHREDVLVFRKIGLAASFRIRSIEVSPTFRFGVGDPFKGDVIERVQHQIKVGQKVFDFLPLIETKPPKIR
jgi:hypothetical protein